ncbi:MAG: SDR family oxidoreductase [Simkaniaceae bacterium]|nr:SDR family oxidoreductase [Simkaniaceae bacterium]
MHVLVAGGAGYVGSKLVPELLKRGYEVTVFDLYLYGKVLEKHPHLTEVKGDVRNLAMVERALLGVNAVIHLACISNDPSFELNPQLGKEINLEAFKPFVLAAKEAGVERFIFASSSSVYGVKQIENVSEDMALEPLTDYSKFKAECEKVLLKYKSDDFITTILRPATVCGYAPRQRLDLVVNILTNLAYHTGKIKVMGGEQLRPNIHINDMVRAYIEVLEAPKELIQGQIFNVGYGNESVMKLGEIVEKVVGKKRQVGIAIEPTNDLRSYHISSGKIQSVLGFTPKYTIEDAVEELVTAFEAGQLPNSLEDKRYFNIKMMKELDLK